MDCSACGAANEPGRKFCKACGTPLVLVCPACSSPNSTDSLFCGECGSPLGSNAGAAPAARPATGAAAASAGPAGRVTERRLVSVLFADLVGFTTLSEHRDAEDVRELLSRYFDASRDVIERHGGLVEKFIGDAVMAVWGTPTTFEDDAERAVRAALELLDAVAALGRDEGLELRARAGVLTGEAAVTVGAASEGIVAGDLVNTASRLQSAAEPGTVLVGDATRRAAEQAVAFADAGELVLKGKGERVHAWRAVRVTGQRGGGGRSGGLDPPFVGRTEELRLIKELLHATGRERKARLVSVTGIGGIGKSRLAWEFKKYVDGLAEDVYWHQGRCPAYGDGVTFWALGEMVRMRAGIAETDDPAESRAKLAATVAEYVPEDERGWVLPRLAHLLGLDEAPPGEREELFSAWRTLFERIAERGITVLVFEDIQWADPGLLDFVESILEWSRSHPILIVTLARPELAGRRSDWGVGSRSFTGLHLEPLPDEAIASLVEGFVLGLPADGVARVVERAEGVPLYAVETVRMLADRGVLEAGDDAYRLVGDLGELDIPDSLHALIAARLDALDPEDRGLLQDAAVLGKSFTLESLAAVTGAGTDGLEPRLRELARREFLVQERDPRSPERGQWAFLQALIREVAYATLSKADRRRKHLATAHQFEAIGDEELAGVVATHYVEAFRATPEGPDAEALAARARDWLRNAGERAISLGSPAQAAGFAAQALAITPGGAERASLLELAADATLRAGQTEAAVEQFEEAIRLYRSIGDLTSAARSTAAETRPFGLLDRRLESIQRMEAALADIGEDGDERVRAELYSQLAGATNFTGDPVSSLAWADRALALAERLDLTKLIAETIGWKGVALQNLGRHREALMLAVGSLELVERIGDSQALALAYTHVGVLLAEADPRGALRAFLDSVDAGRRAGMRDMEVMGYANAAEGAIDVGDWATADRALTELRDVDPSTFLGAGLQFSRAMLAAYRGDQTAANELLDRVAPRLSTEMVTELTWHLRARSVVRLMDGRLEDAYEEAMRSLDEEPAGMNAALAVWAAGQAAMWLRDADRLDRVVEGMGPLRGEWIDAVRQTLQAGRAALRERLDEAGAGFRAAFDTWAALDLPLDLAYCVIDAVTLLPREAVPVDAVERARRILAELGAGPMLERLASATHPEPAAHTP